MRILFVVPHYFKHTPIAAHGSEQSPAAIRAAAIRACLVSLYESFAPCQGLLDGRDSSVHPANTELAAEIDIVLCTSGGDHLVPDLPNELFHHVATDAAPRLLGFECHRLLRDHFGQYDFYAYLEDDLRIADPLFFPKLAWFAVEFGPGAVLQPNRFERSTGSYPYKLYNDGNLRDPTVSPRLQRIDEQRHLRGFTLGRPVVFQRVDNPHSGCFFLNQAQLAHWLDQPGFAEPSADFCGPLESAATLGIMRHFRAYKPARENAGFLEVEHLDPRYIDSFVRVYPPPEGTPPG